MKYEAVIGLEVHVQVQTRSKMFCGCPNQFGAPPNTNVCPVCLGYPGVLPVPNCEAIRKTIIAGLMCNCDIAGYSKFDRKNYFYPDMPKNYQISQYDLPFCIGGGIPISGKGFSGAPLSERSIGLTRIHLEEDVAKSTHFTGYSGVDYNRAGVPLMEIVSDPDMHTADEAYAYLSGLKQVMQYAGISDCDMEKGQMRCDVNISLRLPGAARFGTKIEIKNLNSLRAIHRSLEYEMVRQAEALDNGEELFQETRRWDDSLGVTLVMRTKESAHDYRYFPEPDLMPVEISDQYKAELAAHLPETPPRRRNRFVEQYGITLYDADILTLDRDLADYFEQAAAGGSNPKLLANWIISELLRELGAQNVSIRQSPVSAERLGELVALITDNTISSKIAKTVFEEMLATSESPLRIVEAKGLRQVTDSGEIEGFVEQAIAGNPAVADEYRAGKTQALQFFVGQVMKLSRGKANPKMVIELLQQKLS